MVDAILQKIKESINKLSIVESLKEEYNRMNDYGKTATLILAPIVAALALYSSCRFNNVYVPKKKPTMFEVNFTAPQEKKISKQ